jgi:NADPH:quinone reductase-like Zn-dependent oxidoreductase
VFERLDMICRNGGLISVITNGGFAEYIVVPQRNVFKIPDDLDWNLAASLPVTTLTRFHALNEAHRKVNEYLLDFGAAGNTRMVATQLEKDGSKSNCSFKRRMDETIWSRIRNSGL